MEQALFRAGSQLQLDHCLADAQRWLEFSWEERDGYG